VAHVAVVAAVAGPALAQNPSPRDPRDISKTGTGTIRGRVTTTDSAEPLRRVRVRLTPQDVTLQEPRTTITDDDGRYVFAQLPAGRYEVDASKGGYVEVAYGQRRPFEKGRPIELADRQVLDRVDMKLPRGAIVAGRVVDEAGEPVARASVQLARHRYIDGARKLVAVSGDSTDDRGEFRIFGVPPAEYVLSATFSELEFRSADRLRYVRTFLPGTSSLADARPIAVKLGEELTGLTVALVREQTASISGVVRQPTPSPFPFSMVVARRKGDDLSVSHDGIAGTDGTFSIGGVLPGTYVVEAQSFSGVRASAEVTLSGADVSGVILTLSGGTRARGQVRFEGGTPPRDLQPSQLFLFAESFDGEPMSVNAADPRSPVAADWTFELTGLTGRGFISGGSANGWIVKTVTLNGTDFTDSPIDFSSGDVNGIEVLLSNRTSTVAGQVADGGGAVAGDASVVIFPRDPDKWTRRARSIAAARPDQQGRFSIVGLPAGQYLAIAVDYLEEGEERDPDLLKEWGRLATSFTLGDGETRTVNLLVTPSSR
jgi:hypothetical protein